MILDESATACPSPQVQTSIEEHWGRFHPVPALNGVRPEMPLDAGSLVLGATYNALGNEELLRLVDLETKTKACCRTGNSTETKLVVDHVLEGTEEAYWRASRLFRPFMLAAETAGQALARVRPAIDALATFSEERASAVEAPLALASDAVALGAAGAVEVAAVPLETAVADAFVDAFVGRDDVTRDEVLAGLGACLAAVERFGGPLAALREALRGDISRAALAPDVAADAIVFSDIASTREPDVLEAAREALGRVARCVDDGSGGGALSFLRGELAHQTSALDRAVVDGQICLYGEAGNGYGGESGGPTVERLRAVVDWDAMALRDDIDKRAATLSGGDRSHIARILRASGDDYNLVYEVAPLTMKGFLVDEAPAFSISCVVSAADANVTGSVTDVPPRRFMETDAACTLAAMRLCLHSMHSGGAPISLDAVGLTVDYLGREVHRLFRKTPTPSSLSCSGAVLRMGMGCETLVSRVGGDRYDIYGRGKKHFGTSAYFPWESSGCGDVGLFWSATVDPGAVDAVFNRATGLTADGLQLVYDEGVKTLKWQESRYNASDALYDLTFVRKLEWDAVTSVEGSGVIEGSVIARGVRMDVAVANADEDGFFSQVFADALKIEPGAVRCINQMVRRLYTTSARRRGSTPSPRRLLDGIDGFYTPLVMRVFTTVHPSTIEPARPRRRREVNRGRIIGTSDSLFDVYAGAVAVEVENAAIAADVERLRAVPRGSDVVRGSVDSLQVAMVGGGTPWDALTSAFNVHYALEEAESDKVKYVSRLAGFKESCAEALDAAELGEFSKFLLLGGDVVGPDSRAAVVGSAFRSAVVGVKVNRRQGLLRYRDDQGQKVTPHACCVVTDDVLLILGKAAEAGASFTAPDGSRIQESAAVDVVLVPIDYTISRTDNIKSRQNARMRQEARYVWMSYVDALLDSDASFDNEELRRHHAVYKPGRGNWDGPFSGRNAWTWPGPPTEPYPPGFGES